MAKEKKFMMNQRRLVGFVIVIGAVMLAVLAGYFIGAQQTFLPKSAGEINSFEECVRAGYPVTESYPRQCRTSDGRNFVEKSTGGTGRACTEEAKQCPDGSYVSRTGKNCEFAPCPSEASCKGGKCPIINPPSVVPSPITECKKDSDCPSSLYSCETIQGAGTVCPSNDPSCVPTSTIVEGVCKLKEGNWCGANDDCAAGNLCHKNICTSPIGKQCGGQSDTSCPTDYECVQGCGSPVPRPNELPPAFFCQLKGYDRPCPICLASNTLIDTPSGSVSVKDLQVGMPIWTTDKTGHRVSGFVIKTSKVAVPPTHQMVHLMLDDGRELFVSPGHPTIDGRTAGSLQARDLYDGAHVTTTDRVTYSEGATYDILPSGETGFYWANDILLDSTLH